MPVLNHLQNNCTNPTPLIKGVIVGFGATALLGSWYYVSKNRPKKLVHHRDSDSEITITTPTRSKLESVEIPTPSRPQSKSIEKSTPVRPKSKTCEKETQLSPPPPVPKELRTVSSQTDAAVGDHEKITADASEKNTDGKGDREMFEWPPAYPCLLPENRTLLARYLSEEIYDRLAQSKTRFGATLDDCIQIGVDNLEGDFYLCRPSCGFVAADAECYTLYENLFQPIIRQRHHIVTPNPNCGHSMESGKMKLTSVEVRVYRNLLNVPFASRITRYQRRLVFNTIVEMCQEIMPEHEIFLLTETQTPADEEKLHRLNLLADMTIDNPYRLGVGQYRDPFDARGIVLSRDESAAVIINSLDHMVFVGRDEDGSVEKAYTSVLQLVNESRKWLQRRGHDYAFHKEFGFLTVMPEKLGAAATVKARVSILAPALLGNFVGKLRTAFGNVGLIVSVEKNEAGGWFQCDVETVDTFYKGEKGCMVGTVVSHFANGLKKVCQCVENF